MPNVVPRTHKHFLPIIMASDGSYEDFLVKLDDHWPNIDAKRRLAYLDAEESIHTNYLLVALEATCPIVWK